LKNVGGLIMPVILMATFEDGSTREIRIPAEIWRVDSAQCDTLIVADQPLKSLELDPYRETADINRDNNFFPPVIEASRFQLFKMRRNAEDNPMQKAKSAAAAAQKAAEAKSTTPDESKSTADAAPSATKETPKEAPQAAAEVKKPSEDPKPKEENKKKGKKKKKKEDANPQ